MAENQSTDASTDTLDAFETENIPRGMVLTRPHLTEDERAEAAEMLTDLPVSEHHVVVRSIHGQFHTLLTLPHMSILTDALDALVAVGDLTREADGVVVVGGNPESEEDDLIDLRIPVYACTSVIGLADPRSISEGAASEASPEEQLLAAIFGGTPEDYAGAIVSAARYAGGDDSDLASGDVPNKA